MSTPANEPKMPEVIYAMPTLVWRNWKPTDSWISYTRTDKVQELKEALRKALENAVNTLTEFGSMNDETRVGWSIKECEQALTKASNLLK